jgi:hypothetical protein
MNKKLAIGGVVLLLIVGGGIFFFLNQQAQNAVKDLNANLPEGVKVTKSLFGNTYTVVNEIDGYEFKIPDAWEGVTKIAYIPKGDEQGYTASSIGIEGQEGFSRMISIDRFEIDNLNNIDLTSWAKTNFDTYGLEGEFAKDSIGVFEIVKTQENVHLLGMYVYFFQKDSAIYAVTNGSEEFIREIITNGKW